VANLWANGAPAMSIGVFADSLGTDCSLIIPFPGEPTTLFVVASLQGLGDDGVVNGSFRISGVPAEWTRDVIITPGAQLVGDVFGAGGCFLYANCTVSTPLVLMKLRISPTSPVQQGTTVSVTANSQEAECFLWTCGPCARFGGCSELHNCYCATEIESRINGACSVAVTTDTWSVLKVLFR